MNSRYGRIILASGSPRRRELLEAAGIPFDVITSDIEEERIPDEPPERMVCRLALEKARSVSQDHSGRIVLGADTVVVFEDVVLGKPSSMAMARKMLAMLSGNRHRVLTGVALVDGKHLSENWCCSTHVTFKKLSDADIERYLSLVDVHDKAGAYAIQSHGELLVESVEGLLSNVIGLPVEEVQVRLAAAVMHGKQD